MTDVDFTRGAGAYDRRHGASLAPDAIQRMTAAAHLPAGALILDIGAGTGRVAIPLAATGRSVVALDPAKAMLRQLINKSEGEGGRVDAVAGEGSKLPFHDSQFDAVMFARVLYLMTDWRNVLSEAIRVLKPAGRILHEWGNGVADEEWVQIREHARQVFERAGVANPFHPGVRTEQEVEHVLRDEGLTLISEIRLEGTASLTLAEFLGRIVNGECSYTWNMPAKLLPACLTELERWAAERFDLHQPRPIPRETTWKIYAFRTSR
jgi:SAM-dependent methyltransferase